MIDKFAGEQGNLKVRTHGFACRAGHPALWTADDLEGARLQGNEANAWQKTGAVSTSAPNVSAPAADVTSIQVRINGGAGIQAVG